MSCEIYSGKIQKCSKKWFHYILHAKLIIDEHGIYGEWYLFGIKILKKKFKK